MEEANACAISGLRIELIMMHVVYDTVLTWKWDDDNVRYIGKNGVVDTNTN